LNNKDIYSKATILTTGTFLNGKIYFGNESIEAGRINNKSSKKLALFVKKNFQTMRLKTGTPPRIYKKSIDYSNLSPQPSENNDIFLSFFTKQNKNKMIDCYITKTNNKTHKVIRDNLDKSAMYSGIIKYSRRNVTVHQLKIRLVKILVTAMVIMFFLESRGL